MRKRRLRLFVAVRLHPRDPLCLNVAEDLRRALAPNTDVHIHWNLPSFPFSENRRTWRRFLESLVPERNTILPLGFYGLDHPLLQIDELRRELDWGMRNPFDPEGFPRSRSRILLCPTPDLSREQAREIYLSRGINRVAVPGRTSSLFEQSLAGTSGGLTVLRYRRLSELLPVSPKRIWRSLRDIGESRLLLLAETHQELQRLAPFLSDLATVIQVEYGILDQEPAWALETVNPPAGCLIPDGPICRGRAMAANPQCLRRRTNNETVEILRTLGRRTRTRWGSPDSFPPGDRENVAHMQGDVDLSEGELTAHFQDGRIAGISSRGDPVTPRLRTLSRLSTPEEDREITITSAFSIEGPRLRGLRILSSNLETGVTMLQDSFFVEDCPFLLTTCRLICPEGAIFGDLAPIEIPVAQGSEEFLVEALYRGGEKCATKLDGREDPISVAASLLYVPKGGLVIGFPQEKEPLVHAIQLRVARQQNGSILFARLFGTDEAAGEASGATEIFSFFLGAADTCPGSLPHLPKNALDQLPTHAVHWD